MIAALAVAAALAGPPPEPLPGYVDPQQELRRASLSLLVPGLGQYLNGDRLGAALALGSVAAPLTLGLAGAPPQIFADTPSKVSLFLLTAQEAWSVQAYLALQRARVDAHGGGMPDLVPHSLGGLLAAPFAPAQLLDWRVWATVATLIVADQLLTLLFPDPPMPDAPYFYELGAARAYGHSLGPNAAYALQLGAGALVSLHAGVGEETLFRGIAQDELEGAFGPAVAVLGSAAVFGAAHVGGVNQTSAARQFGAAALAGVALGLLHIGAGHDVAKGIAAHFWYDVFAFGVDGLTPTRAGGNLLGLKYAFK